MVAASEGYRVVEAITREERRLGWLCDTCGHVALLLGIARNEDQAVTTFTLQCADGEVSQVLMNDEVRAQRGDWTRFAAVHHHRAAAVTEATNETMRCRCLSGCGHATWISQPDATRDGRIVRLQCREGIDIFVGEQTWRAGISRISYRHDGNYVILGADGKLVGEGRVEVPRPYNPEIRVAGTWTVTGQYN